MGNKKSSKPLVSVLSIAYNHGPYIEQMIKGVLMQETDFDFELIIHDDASIDETAKIIKKYAKKNLNVIKPIFESENQYSKGTYDFINDMFKSAQGKYIAFCEGDDYWTDPNKLQLQTDFMENHLGYALVFHPVEVIFEDSNSKPYIYPDPSKNGNYHTEELLRGNYIQINSVLYKKQNYDNLPNDVMPHDWFMHLYHAQFGKIGFINKTMAVYRKHVGGVWSSAANKDFKFWNKFGLSYLKLYESLIEIYGTNDSFRKIISKNILEVFHELSNYEQSSKKLDEAVKLHNILFKDIVVASNDIVRDQKHKIKMLEKHIKNLDDSNRLLHETIIQLENIIKYKNMPITKKLKAKFKKQN